MKSLALFLFVGIFLTGSLSASVLKEGDLVKNFRILADNGTYISLGDYKGKWVILYFYPKDDTYGCTKEAKRFSELKKEFEKLNAVIFGINKDSMESHKKFKKKHKLTITLLTDKNGEVSKFFGVKTFFGMCKRDTILINPEGKVERIYRGVDPEGNPEDILTYLKEKTKR